MLRNLIEFIKRDLRDIVGSNPLTILAGVGVMLLALIVMVVVTLLADNAAEARRDQLAEDVEPFAINLGELEAGLLHLSADVRGYVLTGETTFQERYEQRRAGLVEDLGDVRDSGDKAGFAESTETVIRDSLGYLTSADAAFQAKQAGQQAEAERLIGEEHTPRLDAASISIGGVQEAVRADIARLRERIRDIDRVERYVLFLAGPLGVISAGVLVWLALTNHRLLRNARTEQARFASMIASVSRYGVCQIDGRGRIEYCNPAGAEMLGYTVEEMIGLPLHRATHYLRADGTAYPLSECAIESVIRSGSSYNAEDSFIRRDGSYLPVDVTSEPIVVNGMPTGAVVVFEDMTQRLQQEQFRQQFLSFASHELRTPLMIISGYAQMLGKRARAKPDLFDEQSRDAIDELEQGTARMRKITEVVLDLTRIQSGQSLRFDSEMVNLRELLDVELETLRSHHPEVNLDVRYSDGPIFLESDEDRVRQVVSNLLDNAAKYGGDPPRVRMQVDHDNSHVVVRVADEGPGIPAEEQAQVFERFYRGSKATGKQGMGVGLFITKRIVERLGGTLSFVSAEGKGTEFTLTLPVSRQPEDEGY